MVMMMMALASAGNTKAESSAAAVEARLAALDEARQHVAPRMLVLQPSGREAALHKALRKRVKRPDLRFVDAAELGQELSVEALAGELHLDGAYVTPSHESLVELEQLHAQQERAELYVTLPVDKVKQSEVWMFVPDRGQLARVAR
jgi:hypothetical protein